MRYAAIVEILGRNECITITSENIEQAQSDALKRNILVLRMMRIPAGKSPGECFMELEKSWKKDRTVKRSSVIPRLYLKLLKDQAIRRTFAEAHKKGEIKNAPPARIGAPVVEEPEAAPAEVPAPKRRAGHGRSPRR